MRAILLHPLADHRDGNLHPSRAVTMKRLTSYFDGSKVGTSTLFEDALARRHRVVVGGRRRHHRLIIESQRIRIELGVSSRTDGVGGFRERIERSAAGLEIHHTQPPQSAGTLDDDEIVLERLQILDEDRVEVGMNSLHWPVPTFRGNAHHLEVLRVVVGGHQKGAIDMIDWY
jgi:hypothetical protein